MKKSFFICFCALLIAISGKAQLTFDVAVAENAIGSIYGSCIEDVNHEIYGGLYIQKIFGESFEEDYQNIAFNHFTQLGGNWSAASVATEIAVGADDGGKLLYETAFADGSVEVEIKFNSSTRESAALIVRTDNAQVGADDWDGYEIGLNAMTHEVILGKHVHNWQSLGNTPAAFNPDEWTTLRVELSGANIKIYVGNMATPVVDYTDNNSPLLSGKIGVRTWRSDASFRNLKIKTGSEWQTLSFEGKASSLGMWDIVDENNLANFSAETNNVYNGLRAAKIVRVSGSGKSGLVNAGLNRWGIAVEQNRQYDGRIYLRGDNFSGNVTVALQSADGQTVYAQQTLTDLSSQWQKYSFSLTSNATDANARFAVWTESAGTVFIDQVAVEGTGDERFHGLPYRADIGNAMVAQGLNFLRYGGTMVNAAEYRFKKMIGDPDLRPPYRGHWYQYSTNGFGIEDFLKFCEAAGFEAAFAINIEETAQDAADMVEYLNGDASTVWGAKRAENGHPAPYGVRYIEIGNEEVLFNGDVTDEYTHYIERFNALYDAMKAKDPNLKFINSAWWRPESGNCQRVFTALNGKADYWDYHPWTDDLTSGTTIETELRQMQSLFKQWDANTEMRCAIFEENGNTHNLQRAITHAAVLNTVRRLGDFVLTSCAANALQPYLQNDNGWDQGQIFFTPMQVWGQPTYYAQQMASENHLPLRVKQSGRSGSLDVTATTDENRQAVVIHVVNTGSTERSQSFTLQNFDLANTAQVTVLQGELTAENTPDNPEKIVPQHSQISVESTFQCNFPPHSYTIIRLNKNVTAIETVKKKVKIFRDGENLVINCPQNHQSIRLYNLAGQKVITRHFSSTQNGDVSINISHLPRGVYFVDVAGEAGLSLATAHKIIL